MATLAPARSTRAAHPDGRTFVHFTSEEHAELIATSGELWLSATIVNSVFAAAVGGRNVPGVQYSCRRSPEATRRNRAVIFTTDTTPDNWFPEEVIWRRDTPLPIHILAVTDATEAEALLDDSLNIDDAWGWHHIDNECGCPDCDPHRYTH